MKKFVAALFLVAFVFTLGIVSNGHAQILKEGQMIGSATIESLDGSSVDIKSLAGDGKKKTLIVFFNTSCSLCIKELNFLNDIYTENGKVNVVSIGIDIAGVEKIKIFARSLALKFPVFSDPTFGSGRMFGFGYTPATVLLAEDGTILKKYYGYRDEAQKDIENLFK